MDKKEDNESCNKLPYFPFLLVPKATREIVPSVTINCV